MVPGPDRRAFLRVLLGGAAGLSLSATALPRAALGQPRHATLAASRLGDHLTAISGAGGNVLVVSGPEGLVLVNGGRAERSAELLGLVAAQVPGKRILTVFNTDWHPDHTGSNEPLGASGAQIIAHEHTKQYLGAEIFVEWQDRTYKPLPPHALPGHTIYTSDVMTFGAERIEYGHLGQAHTDGDIYVLFPGSNVLMTGDVLTVGTYPIGDYTTGGWLGGLVTATRTLLDLTDADTRIVPGVGPLQTRADLQAQYDMLATMRDRIGKMMRQGMGPEDILAQRATGEFDARWGNPDLFVSTAYRGMWLHVRELGGVV